MWVSGNKIFLSLFIFLSAVGVVIYLISFLSINTNVSYPTIDSTNSLGDPIMKKVIWIFWEKGWQTAPYLPQKVLLSWKFHNPDWHIEELTMDTLANFVDLARLKPTMTIEVKSDMIRLMILSKYGGVWVEASMLCLQPLDNWIWAVLPRNGFWMYSRECSWFMIAASNSFIAQAWLEAAIKYWETRTEPSGEVGGVSNYRWMDGTLKDARANNKSLDAKISAMVFINCGSLCGPSTFYLRDCMYEVNMPLHEDIRKCFDETPPYVAKLTLHGRCGSPPVGPQNMQLTNGKYAILTSFANVFMADNVRKPLPIFDTSNLIGSLIAPRKHLSGKFKSDYSKAYPLLVCASLDENSVHTISCPYRTFVRTIDFASYGTPTGSCGAFSKGSCDSSYTMTVVTSKCLNKVACTVSAQNSIYGDPCDGTHKHMYVQVTCY